MATVMRFDDDHPTNARRALQCYLVLIGCAARRETCTYSQLAERLGYRKTEGGPGSSGAGVMGARLGALMFWCKRNGLPPLTAIVVNATTGMPGKGIYLEPGEVPSKQQEVFSYDWFAILPPTEQALEESKETASS